MIQLNSCDGQYLQKIWSYEHKVIITAQKRVHYFGGSALVMYDIPIYDHCIFTIEALNKVIRGNQ
ncbi:hypothetical protein EAH72_17420 [Pseudomonas caspiana]|nr:hypothetical protein EAH72_17420 [Pseudomonas caspiana]